MIDIQLIRENPKFVTENAKRKKKEVNVERILELDELIRETRKSIEDISALKNQTSERIANATQAEKSALIAEMQTKSENEKALRDALAEAQDEFKKLMYAVPNILASDVPDGQSEDDNQVIRRVGEVPVFSFPVRDHLELGKILDCVDTETASEVSGARFTYLKNGAAELQLAIMNLVIDTLTNENTLSQIAKDAGLNVAPTPFQFVLPPVMIRPEVYRQMGRLSDEVQDERYYLQQDDLYLVGSAEHTLGPMLMNKIVDRSNLPLRYIGYSSCFRREAGSYGKDTKGIIRLHQFDKLEMETFTTEESALEEQLFIIAIQEYLVQKLELPYEVIMICTGDIGTIDARQVDINCWIPSQQTYRETHTSDLMTDYQARRLNARYRTENGTKFLHMNDATAFAMSRIIVAVLENHQQENGSVRIPSALQPYMRGKTVIEPRS